MTRNEDLTLTDILDDAFSRFGPSTVAWAALRAAILPKSSKTQDSSTLCAHMRRDIGLPPAEPSNKHWRYLP